MTCLYHLQGQIHWHGYRHVIHRWRALDLSYAMTLSSTLFVLRQYFPVALTSRYTVIPIAPFSLLHFGQQTHRLAEGDAFIRAYSALGQVGLKSILSEICCSLNFGQVRDRQMESGV